MNKKILSLLICVMAFTVSSTQAQEFKLGLKGGINKTFGGEIVANNSNSPGRYTDDTFNPDGKIGFHVGGWAQVNFGKFFVRPELVYSKVESEYVFPGSTSLYEVSEFSVPLLVGYNVWGPLDIYAGPAYRNIIDATMEKLEPVGDPPQVVVQNSPFSAQIGAKVEFGSFGLDVRYEKSLATADKQGVDFLNDGVVGGINKATITDARYDQIIVSLTFKLWDTANKDKRRRRGGGSCYF